MSDRRVLAMSAAAITLAIMAFLVATYPSWRTAIKTGGSNTGVSLFAPGTSPGAETASQPRAAAPALDAAATPPTPSPRPAGNDAEPRQDATATLEGAKSTDADGRPSASKQADASTSAVDRASDQSAAGDEKPSFDIVRVEPTGDSVVAARAKPGVDVVLLDQGEPIARAKADANGQVAFVPPTLAPGDHSLMLSIGDPKAPGAISSQSVAVSVPAQAKTAPLVALIAPDQPTKILSGDTAAAPSAAAANSPAPNVAVSTIDVEELGGIYATGKAQPDSHCRVYLNGSFIAAVTAGKDGAWSLKIKRGMRPGRYTVRVDQMQAASGQVQARAEVPFDYPTQIAGASPLLRPKTGRGAIADRAAAPVPPAPGTDMGSAGTAPASTGSPAGNQAASTQSAKPVDVQVAAKEPTAPSDGSPSAVVAQLLTTKVVHGDSLWRISRKMLGHGVRYTQIYAANTSQIRDPKLIYPGQIFVLPQNTP